MTIVIVNSPMGDEISIEVRKRYYWAFFAQGRNIEEQWKVLEGLRVTGGLIMAQPFHESALFELIEPYLNEDGYIAHTGHEIVHTKEHGDFEVFLYDHKRFIPRLEEEHPTHHELPEEPKRGIEGIWEFK